MISFDNVKVFLPKYLTPDQEKELFIELENFPNNIDMRFFSRIGENETTIFQGDGYDKMLVINLPDPTIRELPAIILSNTCDNNPGNVKKFKSNICYAPLFRLDKYKKVLLDGGESEQAIESHIKTIKKQWVAQIFYLPKTSSLDVEHIVFFDRIISCSTDHLRETSVHKHKIFCLSDYGFYLFVIKLSIHFTRINEGESRGSYLSSFKI